MSGLARGEMAREARRVLPRLHDGRGRLELLGDGARYGLRTARSRSGTPRVRVRAAIVEALMREGLLAPRADGTVVLTAAGEAWVRRAAAAAEPFRAQHQVPGTRLVEGRGTGTGTQATRMPVNLAETPLGWLRRRKGRDGRPLISDTQFEAGERLRADFTRAQMMPRTTADWSLPLAASRRNAGPRLDPGEAALAARERFYRALEAVGPGLADPLVDVCCHLKGLEDAERGYGWPQRAGKVVLAIALDRLAAHYGLTGAPGRSRTRLWRAEDET